VPSLEPAEPSLQPKSTSGSQAVPPAPSLLPSLEELDEVLPESESLVEPNEVLPESEEVESLLLSLQFGLKPVPLQGSSSSESLEELEASVDC
jgi:hypothetical protein